MPTDNEPVLMLAVTQQLTSRYANKWYFVLVHVPGTQSNEIKSKTIGLHQITDIADLY